MATAGPLARGDPDPRASSASTPSSATTPVIHDPHASRPGSTTEFCSACTGPAWKAATCSFCLPDVVAIGVSERTNMASGRGARWLAPSPGCERRPALARGGAPAGAARLHAPGHGLHAGRPRLGPGFPPVICGDGPRARRDLRGGSARRGSHDRSTAGCLLDTINRTRGRRSRADPLRRRRSGGPAARAVDRRRQHLRPGAGHDHAVRPQCGDGRRAGRAAAGGWSMPRMSSSAARRSQSRQPMVEDLSAARVSHEISRARGGPHCLSHPLVRDDLG
jgi:hypothetical protein